jgi:hypothetical protein
MNAAFALEGRSIAVTGAGRGDPDPENLTVEK